MEKPWFSDLYIRHTFTPSVLAIQAGVLPVVVDRMLTDLPVLQELAEKVLTALSAMTGQEYNLNNVDVNLYMVVANQSEVATLMRQIENDYTSAMQGLQGLASGTSRHEVITAKQAKIGGQINELTTFIGDDASDQFMMNLGIEPKQEQESVDNG